MSEKIITTVGFQIPGNSDFYVDFSSKKSLMDSDVVAISPKLPYYKHSSVGDGFYQGKPCYGESGSFQLKEDLKHWRNEIINSLKSGKSVFLFLDEKEDFFVETGLRSYSGTGRNRSTTVNVEPSDNYKLLPVFIGEVTSASGKIIIPSNIKVFQDLYESFKTDFAYSIYLEDIPAMQIAYTGKDRTKVLGGVIKYRGGNLILLPSLEINEDKFTEIKTNKKGKEEEKWTKEGVGFGSKLIDALLKIDKFVHTDSDKTAPPDWVQNDKYILAKEKKIKDEINQNQKTISNLSDENERLNNSLLEATQLKDLLYEQGKPLEKAVINALKLLGFHAESYDDGTLELDQIIMGPEKIRCIGECEGKDTRDISIDKMRQLTDNLNEDFFRDEIEEKALGILFGNPERFKNPSERGLDFTKKCKNAAEREEVSLVKTADLFDAAKYVLENRDDNFRKLCREAIYNEVGKIVTFPKIPTKKGLPKN